MREITIIAETREDCRECEGTGIVYAPRCELCGEPLNEQQWDAILGAMAEPGVAERTILLPCQHPLSALREEWDCRLCEGSGLVTWTEDVTEAVRALPLAGPEPRTGAGGSGMREASPRPWKRGVGGNAEFIIAVGDGTKPTVTVAELWYGTLSRDERNANADLIVTAVNAHDDLVTACEAALYTLRTLYGESMAIGVLRSALAKAKEI